MYYLNNTCLLCLSYDKNAITQNYHLEVEKELEYILPAHILRISNIPKHVCDMCMESLKMFCIFKKKCMKSVTIFNKYVQELAQESGSYQYLSVTLTDTVYQNDSKMLNKADDCSLATNYKTYNTDHVEKMTSYGEDMNADIIKVVEDNKENFLETAYSVKNEHSYSKNYKFLYQEHIPKLDIDTIKNDSTFEYGSCELDFTTVKQFNNQTFRCKKKSNPDGVDYLKKNLKGGVFEINNYENDQTVIQEKQYPLKIENKLEEVKKEINEELIIKDEPLETLDSIFECETCELAFGTNLQLISHTSWCKKNKNSIERVNQMQNDCTSSNKSESINIFTHGKKKLKPCLKSYECDVCKKLFKFPRDLRNHKLIHTREKSFSCDVCKRRFSRKSDLRQHKLIQTAKKPYECNVCKKAFHIESYLIKHKHLHTRYKPYKCDLCNKSFMFPNSLRYHKFIHTEKKTFSCEVCRRSFTSRIGLTNHKLIHTGGKPFSCDVCKSSFTSKGGLINHKKLFHTGEKPFSCDVCRNSFTSKSNLTNHKLIHTAEKPYKCDFCNSSFKLNGYLSKHISKYHSYKSESRL